MSKLVPLVAANRILLLRGQRGMLDADLAEPYGVTTKRLNEQVKRNIERFPGDFMFQLNVDEKAEVVANCDHLGRLEYSPSLPYAVTEHGALMLGSVLKSSRAIEVSLLVVRAFVQIREMLSSHKDIAAKLDQLERKLSSHDQAIAGLIDAIRQLMAPPTPARHRLHRPYRFQTKEQDMKTKFQRRLTPDSSALSEAAVAKKVTRLTPDSSALSEAAVAKKVTKAVFGAGHRSSAMPGLTSATQALAFTEDRLERERS